MRLAEALEAFDLALAGEVAPRTRGNYRKRLGYLTAALGEDRPIERITTTELRRWRAELLEQSTRYSDHPTRPEEEGGLSPATVRSVVQATRRFFAWLVEEGELRESPAVRLRLPALPKEPPKAITEEDLGKLMRVAWDNGERDYAIVCVLADTGCRVGGLCSMRLQDVDLAEKRGVVREKGAKARNVYFVEETVLALREWLLVRPRTAGDPLWVGRKGPLQPSGVYQVLKRLARRAGIEGRFNPHAFRHAAARGWIKRGADLSTVSELLGHAGTDVTSRFYLRWADEELAERHQRFSLLADRDDESPAR